MQGRYVPSLLAAIGGIIERHLGGSAPAEPVSVIEGLPVPGACCPQCGAAGLIKSEGCNSCLECGYSKCG